MCQSRWPPRPAKNNRSARRLTGLPLFTSALAILMHECLPAAATIALVASSSAATMMMSSSSSACTLQGSFLMFLHRARRRRRLWWSARPTCSGAAARTMSCGQGRGCVCCRGCCWCSGGRRQARQTFCRSASTCSWPTRARKIWQGCGPFPGVSHGRFRLQRLPLCVQEADGAGQASPRPLPLPAGVQ